MNFIAYYQLFTHVFVQKIHNSTFLEHCATVLQTVDSNIADYREITTALLWWLRTLTTDLSTLMKRHTNLFKKH